MEHVKADIDSVHKFVETLQQTADESGRIHQANITQIAENIEPGDSQALMAALNWFAGGTRSVFLQDANSLIIKPAGLVEILTSQNALSTGAKDHIICPISHHCTNE